MIVLYEFFKGRKQTEKNKDIKHILFFPIYSVLFLITLFYTNWIWLSRGAIYIDLALNFSLTFSYF